ncbi:MAG: type II toxin-antitoxin system Phd/YefM family antitoxin [Patescibacteria group bacterium]
MMNTNIISSTDVQRNFTQVLQKLRSSNEPLVVVRDSQPAAVMMQYDAYKRILEVERQLAKARMELVWESMRKKNKNVSDVQLNKLITDAKRYAKRSR